MTLQLPNTDDKEVMEMAVAAWIVQTIWRELEKAVHHDDAEETLVTLYRNVYRSVRETHTG